MSLLNYPLTLHFCRMFLVFPWFLFTCEVYVNIQINVSVNATSLCQYSGMECPVAWKFMPKFSIVVAMFIPQSNVMIHSLHDQSFFNFRYGWVGIFVIVALQYCGLAIRAFFCVCVCQKSCSIPLHADLTFTCWLKLPVQQAKNASSSAEVWWQFYSIDDFLLYFKIPFFSSFYLFVWLIDDFDKTWRNCFSFFFFLFFLWVNFIFYCRKQISPKPLSHVV